MSFQEESEKGRSVGASGTGQGYTGSFTAELERQNELRRRGLDNFGQPLNVEGRDASHSATARLLIVPLLVVIGMALMSGGSHHTGKALMVGVPVAIGVVVVGWFRFKHLWRKSPFVTSTLIVGVGAFAAVLVTSPRDNINPALAVWAAVLAMGVSALLLGIVQSCLRFLKPRG